MENAERDYKIDDPTGFKILLPAPGQIMLGGPESQSIELSTLGQKVKEYSAATPAYTRVVYLGASTELPYTDVTAVLDELRKYDIDKVKLLVSSREPADNGSFLPKNVPAPDSSLEVSLRYVKPYQDKPNPLVLVVKIGADGKPTLNTEPQQDLGALSSKLTEIFKLREENGVFREGTNEVEKTILVSEKNSNNTYGQVVKLVDAAYSGLAYPVVLTDAEIGNQFADVGMLFPRGLQPTQKPTLTDPTTVSPNDPPSVISGGAINGKAVYLPKPSYPPAARAVKASGAVSVQVLVDEQGNVIEATALSGHPLLKATAVAAAREAKFAPTLLAGKPVKVKGVLTFNFAP